uniref:Uncharacterized protein n=1 Tax=Spongospora subterranea TaxID=70186 RepID=A0A0H5QND3_9EUKA|eukprot:CRZ03082.1 hypothetical protein [Spongospora subterranea]
MAFNGEFFSWHICVTFLTYSENGIQCRPSVRPYMDQPKIVSSIDLIVLFIIEKGSDIFQGFCNCASSSRSLDTLLSVATSATMPIAIGTATAIICGTSFGCFYFSEALACQNVADIDRSRSCF